MSEATGIGIIKADMGIPVLTSRNIGAQRFLHDAGPYCFCDIERGVYMKGRRKMNANINYIGILNMLRYLVEKGALTKAESKKISEHIAKKTGANIVVLSD